MTSFNYLPIFIISGTAIVGFLLNVIGTTIYDLKSIKKINFANKNKNTRRIRNRPLISVIAYSYNQATCVEKFLLSIKNGSYRKYQIILVDDFSDDDSTSIAKYFNKKYPKVDLKIIAKKTHSSFAHSVSYAVKRYAKGDLILITNVGTAPYSNALKNIALSFNSDKNLKALTIKSNFNQTGSLISLLFSFLSLAQIGNSKLKSTLKQLDLENLQTTAMTRDVFGRNIKISNSFKDDSLNILADDSINKSMISYASEAKFFTIARPSYRELIKNTLSKQMIISKKIIFGNFASKLTALKELLLLSQPLIFVWFFVFGLIYNNPLLFFIGWVGTLMMLSFTLWTNDTLKILGKLKLSFYLPIMYIVFIIFAITIVASTVIGYLVIMLSALLQRLITRSLNKNPRIAAQATKNIQVPKTP